MHFTQASLFWLLVPLAAAPLVIHWLSRRFPKRFMFSSIEEIRRTVAGRSRIFRWRHLLMLLLRTLALVALLLAFLKPVIATKAGSKSGGRSIIVMVDHSLSMNFSENGATARSRARAEIERLLDSLGADDRFHVIRVDHAPVAAFSSFTNRSDAALDFLDKSPPPLTAADFRAANHLAAELAADAGPAPDLYYFSDFQRRDWADVEFSMLPEESRLFFVSATDDMKRGNRSISQLELGQGAVIAGGEVEVKTRVANHSGHPWNGKIEAGFGPSHLRQREVTLAPWSEGDFTLVVPVPSGGLLRLTAALPKDDLPQDDTRHLVVEVSDREEVVILTGNEPDGASPAPELFLTTAVDPFGGEKGVYRPKHLEPATLNPAALASTNRVIASRLPALSDGEAGTLVTFLRGGGGVILFLDGEADAANLQKIGNLSGEPAPLRLTRRLGAENLPDGAMRVASGDFRSRFLRLFDGVRRQNLALLEFYDLHHAAATGNGRILLSYADGTPALAESNIGLGTLLVCNFSVAEASSNLARQRLFPAWIHEMLLRMSDTGSAAKEPWLVGDNIAGETWAADAAGRDLTGPSGAPARFRADVLGERMRVTFPAEAAGFYRLTAGDARDLLAFAVNTDADQSDLRTMDPAILPDRAGASHGEAALVAAATDYEALLRGRPAFHWFILAALGFLLIEGTLFKQPARHT
jgi:hypothetical protein